MTDPPSSTPTLAPDGTATSSGPTVRFRDVVAIGSVPAVLVVVFFLPEDVVAALTLSPGRHTPLSAIGTHFVHRSSIHLLGNLATYLAVVVPAFHLSVAAGRRRDFYVAFGAVLLAYPAVLSGLSLPFADAGVVFGFSGVAMAFAGFLPVALVRALDDHIEGRSLDNAIGFFFLGVVPISIRAVPWTAVSLAVGVVAAVVSGAYLSRPARSVLDRDTAVDEPELIAAGVVAFLLALVAGFPANPGAGDTVVNVYVHFLGYSIGFLASYLTFRIEATVEDTERSVRRRSPT